jgi:hypothetical protein
MKTKTNPMQRTNRQPLALQQAKKCHASTRNGTPCQSPAVSGKRRCRMHGGAKGSGAPIGSANGAYRDGDFTKEAKARKREVSALIALVRGTLKGCK